jgi:N-acetyl-anhydromuramyl-L-alanine amidase AmpD
MPRFKADVDIYIKKKIRFIPAHPTCYKEVDGRNIQLIVIHSMEAPEKGNTAENVAIWFSRGADGRKVSAHYCIDTDSIVQCVQTKDVAFAAPGANHNGIQLELAGYSSQTEAAWLDVYGRDMMELAAALCGRILCPKFAIPPKYLNAKALLALGTTGKGITTHAEVTKAFKRSTHTDPGKNFPMTRFMQRIREYSKPLTVKTTGEDLPEE